jgi:SAM-dependent methyltransferase
MSVALGSQCHVVSADLSPLALSYSARRGIKSLCAADAQRLPFADHSFDGVIALDILEHLPDDAASAREICRVLKPGGRVVITVPAYQSLWSGHDLALMHQRRYVASEVRALFEAAGLRVRKLSYAMAFLYPVVWFVRRLTAARTKQEATLVPVPAWANAVLAGLLRAENGAICAADLPFGVTVLCVGEKA